MDDLSDLEPWRRAWRDGLALVLPAAGLSALRDALRTDDPRLTQGRTTTPPPLMCVWEWPVEAACALGLCGAVEHGGFADKDSSGRCTNHGAARVGQVDEFFARACAGADALLGRPGGCKPFLAWFDTTPRVVMRGELFVEVERALARANSEVVA